MRNHNAAMAAPIKPKTLREALLSRLASYEEEVRSGRHVPPQLRIEEPTEEKPADLQLQHQ